MTSNIILEIFLGGGARKNTIHGIPVHKFLFELANDVLMQTF